VCCRYGGRGGGGNYDGASRGKSFDRGGAGGGYHNSVAHDVNGPAGHPRDLSRSMSNDNWREAKSTLADDDHRGGSGGVGGGGASRGWGTS